MSLVLFNPYIDLAVMVMTGYSPKRQYYWNLAIRLFSVISGHSLGVGYISAEKKSVYSPAPADWAKLN